MLAPRSNSQEIHTMSITVIDTNNRRKESITSGTVRQIIGAWER
jgi:hypothetical protein